MTRVPARPACAAFAAAALAWALVATLAGCDYFRAAQPEAPTIVGPLPDYSDPDRTLETIANAIADKARSTGITAYAGAFAESTSTSTPGFHQFFWPTDASNWQASTGRAPPPVWGFALEQNFYVKFVNLRGDVYEMNWIPDDANPDDVREGLATIHRHYQVRTLAEDGTLTSTPAIGFADLTLVRFADGNWRITRWEDRIDPGADPNDQEQVTLGRRRLNTQ